MKTLLVIVGPTGVGKTELSLRVAEHYGCPIINCDSRQIYRGIEIGTAAPTAVEQARVKHYMVGTRELEEEYNAGQYERDALALLEDLFQTHEIVVMSGGSMLYAETVCSGLDDLPAVPEKIREEVNACYKEKGIAWLQAEVARLDPDYWEEVDRNNPARLIHCVEISRVLGKPYSSCRTKVVKKRPFRIVKVALDRPRAELYARIDMRVKEMIAAGMIEEAKAVYPKRGLNSLCTVGYRELFGYLDGAYDLSRAIEMIQQNSRRYAKRQLTWFRKDKDIRWLNAHDDYEKNIHIIDALLHDGSM